MLFRRFALFVSTALLATAQAEPTFNVSPASGPYSGSLNVSRTPEKISFQATLVPDIMAFAYELPLDRIERRPQWMYDNRYNVAVTTTTPASLPEQKRLLQKLLEERFGLVAHRMSYPSPVYFLVRGPKVNLTPTEDADAVGVPEFRCRLQPLYAQTGPNGCVVRASMSDLALWLYQNKQLPVLDKTGITGLFDIETGRSGGVSRGGAEGNNSMLDPLGLKLELHRDGTAESLIIDHIETPRPN